MSKKFKPESFKKWMLTRTKSKAKRAGMEFNLTMEDIDWVEVCPCFGHKLEYIQHLMKDRLKAPSLDRIDNQKGYVKGNVRVVSFRANRIKSDFSSEDLGKIGSWFLSLSKVSI